MRYPVAKPKLGWQEEQSVKMCIEEGWVSGGRFVDKFEGELAKLCDRRYGVATSSGTTALHLALAALGIKRGDLVIVPTLTYIACANAIRYCGAQPIFCDSREKDWQMDMDNVEEIVKFHRRDIKAVIAVHLYGAPCEIEPLEEFCRMRGIDLIEDAAQAIGSSYNDRPIGSFGDISCFSFYGNKNITTGEGGACLTDRDYLANRLRHLQCHATKKEGDSGSYYHDELGFNYRMSNLQAAVGCAQIERLDKILERKEEICQIYTSTIFRPIAAREIPDKIKTWRLRGREVNAGRWLYSLVLDDRYLRDGLIDFLRENNIESRPFFEPCHLMPYLKSAMKDFPVAEDLAGRGINLPTYEELTDEDVKYIAGKVVEFLRNNVTSKG